MLKPERMNKLIITAPRSYADKTINALYQAKAVHIIDHSSEELDIGTPLDNGSKISEVLVGVRALITNLSLSGDVQLNNGFRAIGMKNFVHLTKTIKQLQGEVSVKIEQIKSAEDELKTIENKTNIFTQLDALSLPQDAYGEYASLKVFVGYVKSSAALKSEIPKITDEFDLHEARIDNRSIIALFAAIEYSERISELLSQHDFSELDISTITQADSLKSLATRQQQLTKTINNGEEQLVKLGKKWHDFLLLSEQFLAIELEKAEAPLRFASSENIFVVTGWVPSNKVELLGKKIQEITKNTVEIQVQGVHHDDDVPIKLQNQKIAKPFEFLINLYALPKYNEIDPTLFMFLTFPLFFGIILGDVGYGVTVLLLIALLNKKIPSAKPLTKIVMPAAISSIFFGILFGEVFGFEVLFGYHLPHLISRIHQVQEMLIISLGIGLLHINFGFLIGFINELEHGLKQAILAKGSWWILQAAVAGMVLSSLNIWSVPMYASGILALIAGVMIYKGESISGIVEIPGLISNLLSYSRLMAVGLASVGLAVVVNGFIEEFASAGGIMIVVAIIVGVIGHTINIALGILGGFLHSLRLHYVEFFTKFFKGGATPFQPFGIKND